MIIALEFRDAAARIVFLVLELLGLATAARLYQEFRVIIMI